VGGAILCQSFLRLDLVDEIRLAIVPVLLGDGLRLFENSGGAQRDRPPAGSWSLNLPR
jgi:riboflavin biosynthesis pyrimidine reductase